MMNQPELGKKICELRNAKGITQEELAAVCNVNVRTIQRIETNEVSPRAYTVRLIFKSLDYDSNNSGNALPASPGKWLEQIMIYFSELFNLKTNTMKKISVLSTPIILCLIILFFTSFSSAAQSKRKLKDYVQQENIAFMTLFNSGQIDSLSMRYSINATLMPADSPELVGREAIKGYFYMLYQMGFRFTENSSEDLKVNGLTATDKGIWRLRISNTEEISGYYLSTWNFINNKWYIQTEMSSVSRN